MAERPGAKRRQHAFQAPRGTRDFYPADLLKRRWIEDAWRHAAVCHGFDEIDGPRFEHADLYTVKSGEGILSELFSFKRWAPGEGPLEGNVQRAGSSPSRSEASQGVSEDRAGDSPARADVETWYALRPEFTPTLARMVAAKAKSLPKPIKWFSVGPYFRAERPQRGRLREFLQWNVDLIGSADDNEETKAEQDAEVIACCVDMLRSAGLESTDVVIKLNDRNAIEHGIIQCDIEGKLRSDIFEYLDKHDRLPQEIRDKTEHVFGDSYKKFKQFCERLERHFIGESIVKETSLTNIPDDIDHPRSHVEIYRADVRRLQQIRQELDRRGIGDWVSLDTKIVRGLAYYTGMVFEVHETGGKERAIAGGGRYDKLVELFGGPTTPAVGFAMGDVVLANVLQDKGLLPDGAELRDRLGRRPDVFVISTGSEKSEEALLPTVAALRHAGLHTRHSYKTTRNVGKLLKEAAAVGARFAVLLDNDQTGALKNLDTGEQEEGVLISTIAQRVKAAHDEIDQK